MSDHTWSQENIAAFLVGGLSADDRERLEAHVRDCRDCADALAAARQFDRSLCDLFAPMRPPLGLEDRAVRAARTGRARRPMLPSWRRKLAAGVAATVGLGVAGAGASRFEMPSRLPMPGNHEMAFLRDLAKAKTGLATKGPVGSVQDLTNEDTGIESLLESALSDTKLDAEKPIDDLKSDDPIGVPKAPPKDSAVFTPPAVRTDTDGRIVHGNPTGAGISVYGLWHDGNTTNGNWGWPSSHGGTPPPGNTPPSSQSEKSDKQQLFSFYTGMLGGEGRVNNNSILPPTFYRPGDSRPVPPVLGSQITSPSTPPTSQLVSGLAPTPSPKPGADTPTAKPPVQAPASPAIQRVIIRSGDIEFEVDSFDSSVATVTKLMAGIKGGFIATVNSEKLPNGKMKGTVVVRVPPDHLDGLVLDLRKELGKTGELKGQRIGSQDITKQYTDLESRLKAARTMEQRLLQIIKEGKGEIKQLLEAEKELGVWRTKIEEIEGELRYYSNLVALSTLTITLTEKEIKAAAGLIENERVQAGVEVEDVEAAYRQLLAAVAEAKGRVTKSEVKQLAAGQFNATLNFEVAPDAAGPVRDRLRQLGRVARLEIDRVQQPSAGTVQKDAKLHRGDTQFLVQLYNLANIAPREAAILQVAVPDVPSAYRTMRDAVAKASGRVMTAQINEQDRQNITAQLDFDVRRPEDAAIQAAVDAAGEVVSRQVARAPEGENVTDTKVLYRIALIPTAKLKPRETTTLSIEVPDVDTTTSVFAAQVAEVKGRQVDAQVARERNGQVAAKLVYEVPFAAAAGVVERFKGAGTVRVSKSTKDPQAPDGKFASARVEVTLSNVERIVPSDDGIWPPVRQGLSYSVSALLTSLTWVIFGLCVVLPWVAVGYGGYRLIRRLYRSTSAPVTQG